MNTRMGRITGTAGIYLRAEFEESSPHWENTVYILPVNAMNAKPGDRVNINMGFGYSRQAYAVIEIL